MDPVEIVPKDLAEFLRAGKQLEYDDALCESGRVKLKKFGKLSVEDIYVNSEESPLYQSDPNAGVEGYYAVPAVSLIAKCQWYDPDGILVWLPAHSCYGTWDNDHWDVFIFGGVNWSDIVRDPLPFINTQWNGEIEREYLVPWESCEFRMGLPW